MSGDQIWIAVTAGFYSMSWGKRQLVKTRAVSRFLKAQEHLVHWIQCVALIAALIFSTVQIRDAANALQISAAANEIALKSRISDLVIRINETTLDHPEIESGYTPSQRIQLMRIEYFFQVYNMKEAGVIDDDRVAAEFAYLEWSAKQTDFKTTWLSVRNQYPKAFSKWTDAAFKGPPPP